MAHYSARDVTFGRAFAATVLAALAVRPAGALIATPKVRLSKDPSFNPTPASTVAGLAAQEATFSGYTAGGYTPAFSAVVNLGSNNVGVVADIQAIRDGTSPGVNNALTGWWIDDGTNVIAAEPFGIVGPFNLASPGDYLDLDIAIPFNLDQSAA